MKTFPATMDAVDALRVDTLAICLTADVRPLRGAAGLIDWRMCGRISKLITSGKITGRADETLLTTSNLPGVARVFLFGFGPSERVETQCRSRFEHMVEVLQNAGATSVAVSLPSSPYESLLNRAEKGLAKPLGENFAGAFIPEAPWRLPVEGQPGGLSTPHASVPVREEETRDGTST